MRHRNDAVVQAAFAYGADLATVAAMTGCLAGALHGIDWLPGDCDSIQDAEFLPAMANEVAWGPDAAVPRPRRLRTIGTDDIEKFLGLSAGGSSEHGLGGRGQRD